MIEQCKSCKNKENINGIIGCVYMDADCQNGEKYESQIITNADRIRAMSDEELAEYLCWLAGCNDCEARMLCEHPDFKSADGYSKWLKQIAEG